MGCAGGAHYMGAPPGSLVAVCAEGLDGSLEASGMIGRLGPDFGKIGWAKSVLPHIKILQSVSIFGFWAPRARFAALGARV